MERHNTEQLSVDAVTSVGEDKEFLRNVSSRFPNLPPAIRTEIEKHVDYLAAKAGVSRNDLLRGTPFKVDRQVMLDTIANITAVLATDETAQPLVEGDSEFLSSVSSRLPNLPPSLRTKIEKHVDYLAAKAGVSRNDLLDGTPFKVEHQVMLDAITNITEVLSTDTPLQNTLEGKPKSVEDYIVLAEQTLQGWCSREKSLAISELIRSDKPQTCVEIGVYGGRSLVPAAAALKANGNGVIYGIETWRGDAATEHFTNEVNDEWWRGIDFHAIKTEFLRFIADNELASQVRILEAPSADAAQLFSTIDYLHIDGAHSIYNAAEDVVLYAKKVKDGGIIVMDDTNWETTAPAVAILDSLATRIREFREGKEGEPPSCIIFRKTGKKG